MSKTIIFFGTDTFSAAALKALINAKYSIGAVVTKPDSRQGRGQHLSAPLVKQIAEKHGIPVWQPAKLDEIRDDIVTLGSVVGVLSSYGKIIPQSIIDLFRPGIINIHPSLLPKYRGATPIESAIDNGDATTGVSIMLLSAAMDAGPVYTQKEVSLHGTETQPELYETLANLGSNLLVETLPSILDGSLIPRPQNNDEATYSHLLKKEDAYLDRENNTATELERTIRAHLLSPKSKTTFYDQDIIILKAHVAVDRDEKELYLQCKDDTALIIDELIAPSGKKMSGKAFLNGYAAG